MLKANAWLRINDLGSNVQIKNLTPAEAVLLRSQFGIKLEGQARPMNPFTHLKVLGDDASLTDEVEYARLSRKYGAVKVKESFPGDVPTFPKDFNSLLDDDGEGGKIALPEEPPVGKKQVTVPLAVIPRDDGKDLEPPTANAPTGASAASVDALQQQIAALTALVNKQNATIQVMQEEMKETAEEEAAAAAAKAVSAATASSAEQPAV